MNWDLFKNKFHTSWHAYMKKWVESSDSDKVYAFLKNRAKSGAEIAPKSNLTFRAFEHLPLNQVNVVVYFEEPYCGKFNDTQYADGIPLSCDYVGKMHSHLNEFYDAMEREFYDLNLSVIKDKDVSFYTNQGVLFLNSSLSVEIGSPGTHKNIWVEFNKGLIKEVFIKKNIPIIFCGENVFEQYKPCFSLNPIYPFFVINQPLSKWKLGTNWDTENKFTELNQYLDKYNKDEIMWVNQDVPY